jgi:hypothetical protein
MPLALQKLSKEEREQYGAATRELIAALDLELQNSLTSEIHNRIHSKKYGEKGLDQGSNSPKPSANSKCSYVHYTISEDYTGDETSVKLARLAPLAKKQKSSMTTERFGRDRSLDGSLPLIQLGRVNQKFNQNESASRDCE